MKTVSNDMKNCLIKSLGLLLVRNLHSYTLKFLCQVWRKVYLLALHITTFLWMRYLNDICGVWIEEQELPQKFF